MEKDSVMYDCLWPRGPYSPWNSPGQNTGVGSLIPSPGDLPNPGIKPRSPAMQDSLPAEPQGKPENTGEDRLSLLQEIFLTQELNWGLLHCRRILYQLSYQGSPIINFSVCIKMFSVEKLDKKKWRRTSLVVQWWRIYLPMQGIWVKSLFRDDSMGWGATKPVHHNYWAYTAGACAPQQGKSLQREAGAPQLAWPRLPQLGKACTQQRRPSTCTQNKTKQKKLKKKNIYI